MASPQLLFMKYLISDEKRSVATDLSTAESKELGKFVQKCKSRAGTYLQSKRPAATSALRRLVELNMAI